MQRRTRNLWSFPCWMEAGLLPAFVSQSRPTIALPRALSPSLAALGRDTEGILCTLETQLPTAWMGWGGCRHLSNCLPEHVDASSPRHGLMN